MLKYLPTALLSRGPFRLSVKCYPAACTANILNLKINSGCLVEFGASSGCTSRVSNWGWQAPCPAPAQFLCFFVPPAQACVRKCSRRRVLLYKPGLSAALRFSQGFDLVPRFRKCFLPRWPSGNVLPGKLFVGNIRAFLTCCLLSLNFLRHHSSALPVASEDSLSSCPKPHKEQVVDVKFTPMSLSL